MGRLNTLNIKIIVVMLFLSVSGMANLIASDTMLERATKLLSQDRYEEALNILSAALTQDTDNILLKRMVRRVLVMHLQQQIASGMHQIHQDGNNIAAYAQVAKAYSLANETLEAQFVLIDGVAENPKATELWMLIGVMEIKAERPDEAIAVFENITLIDSTLSAAHHHLAYLLIRPEYVMRDGLSKALGHAMEAVVLEPHNANYLDTLAEIRYRQGQTDEAVSLIKQAIEYEPEEQFFRIQLNKFLGE